MGNTCKSMADSFQCMTKPTTIKNKQTNKQTNKQKVCENIDCNNILSDFIGRREKQILQNKTYT